MKNFIKTFDALQKERPRFMMLECPKFIVNALQSKSRVATKKVKSFEVINPAETENLSLIETYQIQPKYLFETNR